MFTFHFRINAFPPISNRFYFYFWRNVVSFWEIYSIMKIHWEINFITCKNIPEKIHFQNLNNFLFSSKKSKKVLRNRDNMWETKLILSLLKQRYHFQIRMRLTNIIKKQLQQRKRGKNEIEEEIEYQPYLAEHPIRNWTYGINYNGFI